MPTTPEFESLYAQLNPRQRQAVDAIDGPVMVIAGPGTGKTKILTLRIANILAKTDTPPEAILALTFTESGATEMRGRLAQIIGVAAYRVTVTTFHAFCNDIIQQYPEMFGSIAGAVAIAETDQMALIQECIEQGQGLDLLRPSGAPLLYLKAIHHSLNTLKREGVAAERLGDIANREESATMNAEDLYHEKGKYKGQMKAVYTDSLKQIAKLRELAQLYAQYQALLRERRLYDYNDMIMEVARALKGDEQLRLMLQERYQYVLVDEHQDTNNAQNAIIELLASFWDRPNLFVVGDARQSIYRFQGASLENFLYFKDLYKDVRLIELEDNYRSSQTILDAAGTGLHAAASHHDTPISVMALSGPDAERYAIATIIGKQITAGIKPEQIAVLYRDNADGQALGSILEKLSIPHTISADTDVMSDPDIRKLMLILDAVRDYGQPGPLLAALYVDTLKVPPLEVYRLSHQDHPYTSPYAESFTRWHSLARNNGAAETFETIVRESGILDAILTSDRVGEKLAKLHALYDMLRSLIQRHRSYTLLDFAGHLQFIREHDLSIKSAAGTPMPGRVRLMTAHKSKGLEFDHVYMIGATDNHWGPRNRRDLIKLPQAVFLKKEPIDVEESDDEKNLFYVALTRARKTVTITLALRDLQGADLLPCRYISDIKPELIDHPDTAQLEVDWISHRDIQFAARPAQTADIADKDFLNEIFLRQGLSATALNNYLDCPWKYFYRNLVRIPEAPAFPLMYGSAVDRALQEYFERLREGEKKDKTYLLATFRACAHRQPFGEQELVTALARGERALSGYFDHYHAQWHGNIINQLKVPAIAIPIGDREVTLNGKMDRVDILNAANHVIVVDYKTGKPKSRKEIMGQTKDANGDYLRQLTFYNLLLNHFKDGYYTMTKGIIDFTDPDPKGNYIQEEFIISPEQVRELSDTISRVATEILDLAFWDKHCDDKKCQYCALRKLIA